jgi:hypothetical protein
MRAGVCTSVARKPLTTWTPLRPGSIQSTIRRSKPSSSAREALAPVGRRLDGVALLAQDSDERPRHLLFVLYEQDARHLMR